MRFISGNNRRNMVVATSAVLAVAALGIGIASGAGTWHKPPKKCIDDPKIARDFSKIDDFKSYYQFIDKYDKCAVTWAPPQVQLPPQLPPLPPTVVPQPVPTAVPPVAGNGSVIYVPVPAWYPWYTWYGQGGVTGTAPAQTDPTPVQVDSQSGTGSSSGSGGSTSGSGPSSPPPFPVPVQS